MVQQSPASFNEERFIEAVYVAVAACAEDPSRLGRSRLHAALYYADMFAYMTKRAAITGAEYVKEAFGPAAPHLDRALESLRDEGRIKAERTVQHGVPKYVIELAGARRPPSNVLTDGDRGMVMFWTRWVCGFDQTDFGDLGFRRPWESVRRLGDPIPYATAFMMLPKPTRAGDATENLALRA